MRKLRLASEPTLGHLLRLCKRLGCTSLDALDLTSPDHLAELMYVLAGEPADMTPMEVADAVPLTGLSRLKRMLLVDSDSEKKP